VITFFDHLAVEEIGRWRDLLEKEVRPYLQEDRAYYASQYRQVCWLEEQWNPATRTLTSALSVPRLWQLLQSRFPWANIGLVSYGNMGIKPHRDDSYCTSLAGGVNLGSCIFEYWDDRTTPGTIDYKKLKLESGEVYTFNAKCKHAASSCANDRWIINVWKKKLK